jgi:hypothetical protein
MSGMGDCMAADAAAVSCAEGPSRGRGSEKEYSAFTIESNGTCATKRVMSCDVRPANNAGLTIQRQGLNRTTAAPTSTAARTMDTGCRRASGAMASRTTLSATSAAGRSG